MQAKGSVLFATLLAPTRMVDVRVSVETPMMAFGSEEQGAVDHT